MRRNNDNNDNDSSQSQSQSFKPDYRCPNCGKYDGIEIVVNCWALLVQTPDGFETDTDSVDHRDMDWDNDSLARCQHCNQIGMAGDFNVNED